MSGAEIAAVAALFFAILNPFVKMPMFLKLSTGYSKSVKRQMAASTSIAVLISLLVVVWVGLELLELLEVSIEGLQVAGGIIIILIGIDMVLGEGHAPSDETAEADLAVSDESWKTKAVVPLAIPLIVGGGAISVVATVMSDFQETSDKLIISGVAAGSAFVLFIVFFFADELSKFLGASGVEIVTRVFGVVVTSLGVQIFMGGLLVFLPGLL
jgi:multiple antibiotic resistance protein